MTLADVHLPAYEVRMRHEARVAVSVPEAWAALHRTDLGDSWITRMLLTLRGLRRPRATRRLTLEGLRGAGFIPLGERPGREVAFGLVGRFWTPSGGRIALAPREFRDFARPGYAKAVWTFTVEDDAPGHARLVTETRVGCTDAGSRRRFRLYWLLVRPFSGVMRKAMLGAVAREATRAQV